MIMTQEQKDLLLKDLCGRLPHGVKCQVQEDEFTYIGTLCRIEVDGKNGNLLDFAESISGLDCQVYLSEVKPYLFPLSSMTRKQREEFVKFADYEPRLEDCGKHQELYYYDLVGHENNLYPNSDAIDWLDKNLFDYRGLIPMDLANDATGLNIY